MNKYLRKKSALPFLIISSLLSACSVGPRYRSPKMAVPCQWQSPPSNGMSCQSPEYFVWWESLNDPILTCLIRRAAARNLDLYIAATRIRQARLERKGTEGDLYPHIDASAAVGHAYLSRDALVNGLLRTALPSNPKSVQRNVNFYEVGFDADWEIDLFGMTAHELCALKAKVQASEENLCDIWVTLSAEIARNYVELRGLQQRLNLIVRNIQTQEDTVHLTNELLQTGIVSTIDFRQTQQQLSQLLAQKPLIELSINKAIHRLSILIGSPPGALLCELCPPEPLPILPCYKPIGIPSELLRRRPDIRKAERELAAATERVGSAIAALFPRLSLRGFIGDIATQLKNFCNPASTTWIVWPQLVAPIFNSKLLTQDVCYNKIEARRACYEYQKTVLEALEETENAIASFHYEQERNGHLNQAQIADRDAYRLTMQLYQKGFKDYLEVLITQRSLLATEDAFIQSNVDLLMHYISLYKALGGGWQNCPRKL